MSESDTSSLFSGVREFKQASPATSVSPPTSNHQKPTVTDEDSDGDSLADFIVGNYTSDDEDKADAESHFEPFVYVERVPLYPRFERYIHHIILGLIMLAHEDVGFMKSSIKSYLSTCDCHKLMLLIVSFVPLAVQAALNGSTWSWEDLLHDTNSWDVFTKGCYFLIGKALVADPVGYVGQGVGIDGLHGRCKSHLNEKDRLRDLSSKRGGKFLYKYTEGLKDGFKRSIGIVAIALFTSIAQDFPDLEVLYDIIEAIFVILLGVMSETPNCHEFKRYKALCPEGFVCSDPLIATNRIIPTQDHITGRTVDEVRTPEQDAQAQDIEEERVRTANRYDCGFSHQETIKIDWKGLGPAAQRRSIAKGTTALNSRPQVKLSPRMYFDYRFMIPLPLNLLQFLRIKPTDEITVNWIISDETHPYCWIQENIDDLEFENAQRLAIQLCGTDASGVAWSFWLRRPWNGEDWGPSRLTTNHSGIAKAMSVIEAMLGLRKLPVPYNRVLLKNSDRMKDEEVVIPDIQKGSADNKTLNSAFTGLKRGAEDFGESFVPNSVCTCDILLYNCAAKVHTHQDATALPDVTSAETAAPSSTMQESSPVERNEFPTYSWEVMIGLVLLEKGETLAENDICDEVVRKWPQYVRIPGTKKEGWELSLRRALQKSETLEKENKPNDTNMKGNGCKDKWRIKAGERASSGTLELRRTSSR